MNERARSNLIWLGMAVGVLLLAAAFRLVLLHDVPPGLSQDEVFDALMPVTILDGNHALFFREAYGHEPLYHYWTVPFYVMFGESVLTSRLPVAFLGLLLVALTLRWGKQAFGRTTAVVAGLGLAISWWPIIFSRVGIRPIMEPVLLVAAAIFWRKRPWLAGLLLGLSFYTYTGARVVLLIPLLHAALMWLLARRGGKAGIDYLAAARSSLLIFAVAVVVAAPMQITLWLDPSLQQRVGQLSGPLDALRAGNLGPVIASTLNTLGVFSFTGDPRWTYSLPGRPLFDWATAVLFYGGLLLALLRGRRPLYALLLIWLGVTLLPSALTPQSPSTVRLVGAMPVIYLLPGLLVQWLLREPLFLRRAATGTNAGHGIRITEYGFWLVLLTVLLLFNGYRTINDGFVRWPAALETRIRYQTVMLDIARDWQAQPVTRGVVADGYFDQIDADTVTMNLGRDPALRWVQTGPDVAGAVVVPAGEGNGRFYVPEFAPPAPGLLRAAGLADEPVRRTQQSPSFAVYEFPDTVPYTPVEPATFDGKIRLVGYQMMDFDGERPLIVYTYWRVAAPLPSDLKAFVHVVGDDPVPVTQHDGFDAAPTTLQMGDLVVQRHTLPPFLPTATAYQIQIGLYTAQTQQRLLHDGQPVDRFILPERLLFDG